MSYLEDSKDKNAKKRFIEAVSDNTGRVNYDSWIQNLRDNRQLFRKTGWASENLQGVGEGKTAIIIGSSPALEKQIPTLRDIQYDKEFLICGLSSNLPYLLDNGIRPHYVTAVDADKSTGDDWNNLNMDRTKSIVLVANTFAYPPMLEKWKGKLYFLGLDSSAKSMMRKHNKWYGKINGMGVGFPSLMAQFNILVALALLMFECRVLIFVGHELSFADKSAQYYVDRKDYRDHQKRFPHGDIHLNKVHTTTGLLAVKYSLEAWLENVAGFGWFFNCTEAGIFGVSKKFPYPHRIPWIQQLTLKGGIAQARQIMRTGQPFYE